MKNRTLYFGDNLEILREKVPDESVDLIYLDPPFNSNRNYNVLFKEGLQDSPAQVNAFENSWHWTRDSQSVFEELVGTRKSKTIINQQISDLMLAMEKLVGHNDMLAYLTMMTVRLIELRRVLKPSGSIYLHCDPTASHYLKILMDATFGKQNFRNEVVWSYKRYTASSERFQRLHDIIFLYGKSDSVKFNEPREEYGEKSGKADSHYKQDEEGKWYRWQKRKGKEPYKVYLSEGGRRLGDVWEIPIINASAKERLGYPTQKPEALLERIISASSNEGDLVLDPFCGCGTTVSVAERLKRNWVGIDITTLAINLIRHRLAKQYANKGVQVFVDGLPRDISGAKALFKKDPFEFEYWALDLVSAMPAQSKSKENMHGADKGIDGVITFVKDIGSKGEHEYGKLIVQVKGGGVQRNIIATLKGDMEREKADGGLLVTLEKPTQPMKEEAVSAGTYKVKFAPAEFPKIQIITVEELLAGKRPEVPLFAVPYYKEAKAHRDEDLGKQALKI